LQPRGLNGRRVGVRAYTQTTGAWVRGFLAEDYGIDLESITWVTFEDAHLAEYREPANVERAAAGKRLKQMLLDEEIDAAILGDVAEEGPLKHLIPDHAAAVNLWAPGSA
jgi:4,5-dihydroxyphthalate decarboxylase